MVGGYIVFISFVLSFGHIFFLFLCCDSFCFVHGLCPQDGDTALMKAALFGHTNIVKLLLKAGADKEARHNVSQA